MPTAGESGAALPVIGSAGVLAAIAIPAYSRYLARAARAQDSIDQIYRGASDHYLDDE